MRARHLMQRSGGFSLVELMVAVGIGLALTIVVAQLFLGSRRTYATTDDVSRMQENIRYAYQVLSRTTHLAGYRSSPNVLVASVFDPVANPIVTGIDGGDERPDTLTVRYQGHSNGTGPVDNTVVNCLGVPVAANEMSVNTFSIGLDPVSQRNALFCSTAADGSNPVVIVPDVDNMQVLFGVNVTVNGFSVEQYVPGPPVPDNVRSVRIALLVQTPNLGVTPVPDTNVYELIPRTPTVPALTVENFNDTRIRRVVSMTLSLRNRTP